MTIASFSNGNFHFHLQVREGIPPDEQRLRLGQVEGFGWTTTRLDDDGRTLADYGIQDTATISCHRYVMRYGYISGALYCTIGICMYTVCRNSTPSVVQQDMQHLWRSAPLARCAACMALGTDAVGYGSTAYAVHTLQHATTARCRAPAMPQTPY